MIPLAQYIDWPPKQPSDPAMPLRPRNVGSIQWWRPEFAQFSGDPAKAPSELLESLRTARELYPSEGLQIDVEGFVNAGNLTIDLLNAIFRAVHSAHPLLRLATYAAWPIRRQDADLNVAYHPTTQLRLQRTYASANPWMDSLGFYVIEAYLGSPENDHLTIERIKREIDTAKRWRKTVPIVLETTPDREPGWNGGKHEEVSADALGALLSAARDAGADAGMIWNPGNRDWVWDCFGKDLVTAEAA